MRIWTSVTLACASAILMFSVEAAGASGSDRPFMATAGKTAQPIGHYDFCRRYPAECAMTTPHGARVTLTPAAWNALVKVNATINLRITAATDEEVYGRAEFWEFPDTYGDCEDIALLKRAILIEDGWPAGALLITVVRQPNGEGHAVLTVLTDRGDLILDNLHPRVRVWNETDYVYVKRQSETHSGQWTAIEDARTTLVGSTR